MSGKHTQTPWFVSGIRFKMNHREWLSVNRYDEAKKTDENIAIVGYDPRDGLGFADAHFIVKAVNAHDELVRALKAMLTLHEAHHNEPIHAQARAAIASVKEPEE